jgi:ribosomal protein L11 methyltransferase
LAEYPALDLRFPQASEAPLDALLYALLDDFQPIAIQEHEAADGWLVFFRAGEARDAAAEALASLAHHSQLTVTPVDVPDEDWARRSQADLTAVSVGPFVIAPPWDAAVVLPRDPRSAIRDPEPGEPAQRRVPDPVSAHADPSSWETALRVPGGEPSPDASDRAWRSADRDSDQILIVIDPSMGFGTGHHQTTRLSLALLARQDVREQHVLDVGTGSGVLAIAAWRLGASGVTALDYDPDALINARENIERNGGTAAIEVVCADLRAFRAAPAAVVTANLTAAVLMQYAAALRALVSEKGVLIVSGFSPAELDDVSGALALPLVDHLAEGDWVAACFRRID